MSFIKEKTRIIVFRRNDSLKCSYLALVVVAVTVAPALALVALTPSSSLSFHLQYIRTGGIGSFNETLVIDSDGSVTFASNRQKPFTSRVEAGGLGELKRLIERNIDKIPMMIRARAGGAD